MWPFRVVMDGSAFDPDLCLLQGVEGLALRQFISEFAVKPFHLTAFPVVYDYDAAQSQPPFYRFLPGFCQNGFAAEGDWDLIDYSRSRAFARPH